MRKYPGYFRYLLASQCTTDLSRGCVSQSSRSTRNSQIIGCNWPLCFLALRFPLSFFSTPGREISSFVRKYGRDTIRIYERFSRPPIFLPSFFLPSLFESWKSSGSRPPNRRVLCGPPVSVTFFLPIPTAVFGSSPPTPPPPPRLFFFSSFFSFFFFFFFGMPTKAPQFLSFQRPPLFFGLIFSKRIPPSSWMIQGAISLLPWTRNFFLVLSPSFQLSSGLVSHPFRLPLITPHPPRQSTFF